jgi:hypothetical protein
MSGGDLGEQALKNIARPVRAYRVATGGASASAQRTPALALPDKPSIAVLPFQNMSGDPDQKYFADAMVEEIITAGEPGIRELVHVLLSIWPEFKWERTNAVH